MSESADAMAVFNGLQIFFMILGLLFFLALVVVVWLGKVSESWPVTQGKVLVSEVRNLSRSTKVFSPDFVFIFSAWDAA